MLERESVLFLCSLTAGLAVSAPPGPAGAVCVGRTLQRGMREGMTAAAGVAAADTAYAALAAGGIASLVAPDPWIRRGVAAAAAPVLAWLGVRFVARARRLARSFGAEDLAGAGATSRCTAPGAAFAGALLLALSAPGTLPAFVVLFAALGVPALLRPRGCDVAIVAAGVLTGCTCWWFLLLGLVDRLRNRAARCLPLVDFAAGAALLCAAAMAVREALH